MTIVELATAAGVAEKSVSDFERLSPRVEKATKIETLKAIASVFNISHEAFLASDNGESLHELRRRLDAASLAEDRRMEAATQLALGRLCYEIGLYSEAKSHVRSAQALFHEQEDDVHAAGCTIVLADIAMAHGEYQDIERRLRPIVDAQSPRGPHRADAALSLGWALALRGRYAQSLELLEFATEYYVRTRMTACSARALRRMHWVHLRQGRSAQAIELADRARQAFRRCSDRRGEARALLSLGQALLCAGEHPRDEKKLTMALKHLKQAHALAEDQEEEHIRAEATWLIGATQHRRHQLSDAKKALATAYELVASPDIDDKDDQFRILTEQARLMLTEGDAMSALDAASKAVLLAETVGSVDGQAIALVARGAAHLALSQPAEASSDAERAQELLAEGESGERWRLQELLSRLP